MSDTFQCPHCNGVIESNPENAGQEVNCPHCHASLTMPGNPFDFVKDRASSTVRSASSVASRRQKKQNLNPILIAGGGVAAVLLLSTCMCCGVVGLFDGGEEDQESRSSDGTPAANGVGKPANNGRPVGPMHKFSAAFACIRTVEVTQRSYERFGRQYGIPAPIPAELDYDYRTLLALAENIRKVVLAELEWEEQGVLNEMPTPPTVGMINDFYGRVVDLVRTLKEDYPESYSNMYSVGLGL